MGAVAPSERSLFQSHISTLLASNQTSVACTALDEPGHLPPVSPSSQQVLAGGKRVRPPQVHCHRCLRQTHLLPALGTGLEPRLGLTPLHRGEARGRRHLIAVPTRDRLLNHQEVLTGRLAVSLHGESSVLPSPINSSTASCPGTVCQPPAHLHGLLAKELLLQPQQGRHVARIGRRLGPEAREEAHALPQAPALALHHPGQDLGVDARGGHWGGAWEGVLACEVMQSS